MSIEKFSVDCCVSEMKLIMEYDIDMEFCDEKWQKSEVETKKVPSIVTSRNVKVRNVPTVGVASNFAPLSEIRNKIACLRDLLDFSPCSGSATLLEVAKSCCFLLDSSLN